MEKGPTTTVRKGSCLLERLLSLKELNCAESPAQTAVLQYMVREIPITNMTVAAIRDTIIDAGKW
jgi:hypothetical protein